MTWVSIPLPRRMGLAIHLAVPLFAAAIWWIRPELFWRYLVLLACLAGHELGHCVASAAFRGRGVARLTPVFGWADVTTFPDRRQAWVAFGGPAANLLAAGVLLAAGAGLDFRLTRAALPDLALVINLLMGTVNLLPVMPLDGGRILRALRPA